MKEILFKEPIKIKKERKGDTYELKSYGIYQSTQIININIIGFSLGISLFLE